MATTKYSHAFLVGKFNGDVTPESLAKNGWEQQILTQEEYNDRLSMYYKSHVDAMMVADGQQKPDFLKDVHHYKISYEEMRRNEPGHYEICKVCEPVSISFRNNEELVSFTFMLCNLHLYLFPFNITLVAIEIDDNGSEIDQLRMAHRQLINWEENINTIASKEFLQSLSPIAKLLPDENLATIVEDGNNLKIFQIVQLDNKCPDDRLLFEIATFSPIGSVCGNESYSHSEEYFNKLIKENTVSTYYNWKALSLVDSFTVLAGEGFDSWQWTNLYFPLIYLRCIFEKTFCFSRNNIYRLGQQKATKQLSEEIADMERYYFYSTISYKFQPNLVYASIAKGLDIEAERKELARQVKEMAKKEMEEKKEKEEHRRDLITLGLSIFAVFSVTWDLCSLIKDAFTNKDDHLTPMISLWVALTVIVIFALYFFIIKKKDNEKN
ncbi:MAG: hypothetical protein K6G92_12100 [Bacteroidaceae bacterium]|nr:hypothetical protein [Bacteroidaceae bacterium]